MGAPRVQGQASSVPSRVIVAFSPLDTGQPVLAASTV